ncbi:MAG: hypothetical protein IPO36_18610 [Anaerolineales bacterium]|nr:hypothetical protein [Anaerolineales bacterium]
MRRPFTATILRGENAGRCRLRLLSAQAIQVFSQMFGLYPHKTLSLIVIADFQDSMEFLCAVFSQPQFL